MNLFRLIIPLLLITILSCQDKRQKPKFDTKVLQAERFKRVNKDSLGV